MKWILTDAALHDLQSIREYTFDHWGEAQEQSYLDRFWDRFEVVSLDPQRYRHRNDLFQGCQIVTEGKHVILFRAGDNALEIVRVLHVSMDFQRHTEVSK